MQMLKEEKKLSTHGKFFPSWFFMELMKELFSWKSIKFCYNAKIVKGIWRLFLEKLKNLHVGFGYRCLIPSYLKSQVLLRENFVLI
jgi:hypothetical protein